MFARATNLLLIESLASKNILNQNSPVIQHTTLYQTILSLPWETAHTKLYYAIAVYFTQTCTALVFMFSCTLWIYTTDMKMLKR